MEQAVAKGRILFCYLYLHRLTILITLVLIIMLGGVAATGPVHSLFTRTHMGIKVTSVSQKTTPKSSSAQEGSLVNTTPVTSRQAQVTHTSSIPSASAASLVISPSSVTIYTMNGVSNVNPKLTFPQVPVKISNTGDKVMTYPSVDGSSGISLSSTLLTDRLVWNMSINAGFVTVPGTIDLRVTAGAVDGSRTVYTGLIHVTILQVPTFSISTSQLYASGPPDSTNFDCGDVNPIVYSNNFSQEFMPTMTVIAPAGYSFTVLGFADLGFQISSAAPISWGQTININIVIQNQYQLYTIPCQVATSE